ncbi:unnamed protein product, partial [Ixodes pacificus]
FVDFFVKHGHQAFPSAPLIAENDASLLFTNAGMVPFKQVFISGGGNTKMAVSSQKCLRAGGKHNDLENVGYTNRHHTFFEMLGNFSFGDYFKDRAIELAWEFVTKELCLDRNRLWITTYHDDQEAFGIWKKITGFPDDRIIKIDTEDNFWSMGDTGPCGPCSEIFYDYGGRFTEIWNLVFMQYCKDVNGDIRPLPRKCIDTGMGLERITAVMQGVRDNYDTCLFKALIKKSQDVFGDSADGLAHRVIADHVRAAAFLIAEGLMPGSEGRGYVLRRIIRRAVRYAHRLDGSTAVHEVVSALVEEASDGYMGDAYPELIRAKDLITSTMQLEEEGFAYTLRKGLVLLEKEISNSVEQGVLCGDIVFKLYDTYGFPVDITIDIAKERGLKFDAQGFEQNMIAQKSRSRRHWVGSGADSLCTLWETLALQHKGTRFIGYEQSTTKAAVLSIVRGGRVVEYGSVGEEVEVVLDVSPFYAESGGQQGDRGKLVAVLRDGKRVEKGESVDVLDTRKVANVLYLHKCIIREGQLHVGDVVDASIDEERRRKLRANHSATHLLHHALRTLVDGSIQQRGSLVSAEKLRFDFSCASQLTKAQLDQVEDQVNRVIRANYPVFIDNCSLDEAIQRGAVGLFGEKYDHECVRVVHIGDSQELCCGTHVRYVGEIGVCKIISECGISAGVRRIEA